MFELTMVFVSSASRPMLHCQALECQSIAVVFSFLFHFLHCAYCVCICGVCACSPLTLSVIPWQIIEILFCKVKCCEYLILIYLRCTCYICTQHGHTVDMCGTHCALVNLALLDNDFLLTWAYAWLRRLRL